MILRTSKQLLLTSLFLPIISHGNELEEYNHQICVDCVHQLCQEEFKREEEFQKTVDLVYQEEASDYYDKNIRPLYEEINNLEEKLCAMLDHFAKRNNKEFNLSKCFRSVDAKSLDKEYKDQFIWYYTKTKSAEIKFQEDSNRILNVLKEIIPEEEREEFFAFKKITFVLSGARENRIEEKKLQQYIEDLQDLLIPLSFTVDDKFKNSRQEEKRLLWNVKDLQNILASYFIKDDVLKNNSIEEKRKLLLRIKALQDLLISLNWMDSKNHKPPRYINNIAKDIANNNLFKLEFNGRAFLFRSSPNVSLAITTGSVAANFYDTTAHEIGHAFMFYLHDGKILKGKKEINRFPLTFKKFEKIANCLNEVHEGFRANAGKKNTIAERRLPFLIETTQEDFADLITSFYSKKTNTEYNHVLCQYITEHSSKQFCKLNIWNGRKPLHEHYQHSSPMTRLLRYKINTNGSDYLPDVCQEMIRNKIPEENIGTFLTPCINLLENGN